MGSSSEWSLTQLCPGRHPLQAKFGMEDERQLQERKKAERALAAEKVDVNLIPLGQRVGGSFVFVCFKQGSPHVYIALPAPGSGTGTDARNYPASWPVSCLP